LDLSVGVVFDLCLAVELDQLLVLELVSACALESELDHFLILELVSVFALESELDQLLILALVSVFALESELDHFLILVLVSFSAMDFALPAKVCVVSYGRKLAPLSVPPSAVRLDRLFFLASNQW
jgi:hypothetical protein